MAKEIYDAKESDYQTLEEKILKTNLEPELNEFMEQPSEDVENILNNMHKEVESNKIKTEELYKKYLMEYNKKLQVGKLHFLVNRALKNIQTIEDSIIENTLEEKDLNKLEKSIGIIDNYIGNNPEDEKYEMIKMLLEQAITILELEKILKENIIINEATKKSLINLLDNIASKDLRKNYEERINGIVEYSEEDELGAEELENEMNMSNDNSKNEEEIEPELLGDEEEVSNNKERFIKMPNSKLNKLKNFWRESFGVLIEKIEKLESLVIDKNVSIEELSRLYDEANTIYLSRTIQKEPEKVKKNLKGRLDKINRQIEMRIKEMQATKEAEENLKKEQEEKIQKQKSQLEKIIETAKQNPNLQNINVAKAYIEKNRDNRDLFENEEFVNNYLEELDKLYKDNILNSINTKIEKMNNNPSYENIIIAEKVVKNNEEILTKNNLYKQYLDDINKCTLIYIESEMNKIKQNPNINMIENLEKFIENRKDNFENKMVLNSVITDLGEIKKQIKGKKETEKNTSDAINAINLSLKNAKENPTKENIDTAKNLINYYMYDKLVFSNTLEANKLLKDLEELSNKTFKQITEGDSIKYSDLNKFIANKESQINKLRDKEQELRGKLIDLERQDFIHPELKLEKMAPIKRELTAIRDEIKYYELQLSNSKRVLENRRRANVQNHYESLFNNDLASLSNEEIQNASSRKINMDELQKYAQLKEQLNPIKVEPITKKDVSELAADNFNSSISAAMSMRLTDLEKAERLIEDAEKVFWANRSNYPQSRLEELQNNLEIAISTIKNQKYQNNDGKTL